MKPHQNLFDYYVNKNEVYKKLQEDHLRDQKRIYWCNIVFIFLIVAAATVNNESLKWFFLFVSGIFVLQYLVLFIDLSNRNFLMHTIDWIESDRKSC